LARSICHNVQISLHEGRDPPAKPSLDQALAETADLLTRLSKYFGVDLTLTATSPAKTSKPPTIEDGGDGSGGAISGGPKSPKH